VVSPDVALYQRLLKGDEDEAQRVLDDYVKTHEPETVYDEVLMPALCRMRADIARGALTAAEAEEVTRTLDGVLEDRDAGEPAVAAAAPSLRVLAAAARDPIDEAAVRILASRLAADGVAVERAPSALLAAEIVERAATSAPAVVVVGLVAPGGLAHARYVIKRLHARLPELPVVAVRWGPPGGFDEARAQLAAAGAPDVVGTLSDARARVLQYRRVETEPAPSQAA
jgi:hypothetical protein